MDATADGTLADRAADPVDISDGGGTEVSILYDGSRAS